MYEASGSSYGWELTGGISTLNEWSHVVGVWTGSIASLYVNGELASDTNASGKSGIYAPNPSSNGIGNAIFAVGALFDGGSPFEGAVDEIAYYPTALSASKIANHFTAAASPLLGTYSEMVLTDGAIEYLQQNPPIVMLSLAPTSNSNGTVEGLGGYSNGTTATISAHPNPGYLFVGWTGDATGTVNPLLLSMDTNKTIGANFSQNLGDDDGDGLTNYQEIVIYGSNPALSDTDMDGLTDGYEAGIGRYSLITGGYTWSQAMTDAETRAGYLATFTSQEEWDIAITSLGPNALDSITGAWIGGTDADQEGTWTWITGEPFEFELWASGQPDNFNNSDVMEVSGGFGASLGEWFDTGIGVFREGYILETDYATDPAVADVDADGLNDGQEKSAGSNPFLADTDGDGLSDYEEVNLTHTDPRLKNTNGIGANDADEDPDSDNLTNLEEITRYGTNPLVADTDGDGLDGGTEVSYAGSYFKAVSGSFNHQQAAADAASQRGRLASFPNANDYSRVASKARQTTHSYLWIGLSDEVVEGTWKWTDGSIASYDQWLAGEPSGATVENHAVMMENTTKWADAMGEFVADGYLFERVGLDPLDPDTDADGLTDEREVMITLTNPLLADTDGDGLIDGAEVDTHGSSPLLVDTDGDGLDDGLEVEVHHSNPTIKDSDSDGFDDGFEVSTGFDPTLANSTPDALSTIRTAIEFRFNAAIDVDYRIEASTDLVGWNPIETDITGEGGVVTRFYSIENQPKRYFRVRRN